MPWLGKRCEQSLDALPEASWRPSTRLRKADPDETLPHPVFPGKGQSVCVLELPFEEDGSAHRRVEAETVSMYEAVKLQLLVGFHVVAHARR